MTSMSMCCSPSLMQAPMQMQALLYDSAADLDLFSLHRIKNRIGGLDLHFAVKGKLVSELLARNAEYQRENRNQKFCITAGDVDSSVYETTKALREKTKSDLKQVQNSDIREAIKPLFESATETQEKKMKRWFADNYDNLLYDQNGKIPFPVVMAMRKRFFKWADGQRLDFDEPIQELIEEAATSVGIDTKAYTDYEDIWEALKKYPRGR